MRVKHYAQPGETKLCNTCKVRKDVAEFHKARSQYLGLSTSCKDCERIRIRFRHFKKAYGVSREDYEKMLEAQGHACAICGTPADGIVRGGVQSCLTVDHSHKTGKVRGLLCHPCNHSLGSLEPETFDAWAKAARKYLGD